MVFCTDVWLKAALAHVLGHSFRIGDAVELLLAGVPPEIVAATGGWTSLLNERAYSAYNTSLKCLKDVG